jgi:CRP-like cAMP-binding protein
MPLFLQGEPGKNFYVLMSGSMEVIVNENVVNVISPGEGFGELALLHDTPRSATIQATEYCTLWTLDRNTFRSAV